MSEPIRQTQLRSRTDLFARVGLLGDLAGAALLLDDRIPLSPPDDVLEVVVVAGDDQEASRIRADILIDRPRYAHPLGAAIIAALANEQEFLLRAASL
ncbi:MAG TPA: hypothetical protein VFS15_20500, partial [Kofleriaceae bacterium]|nr:hypothetical protein [Kofleriaceae bacterium]